MSEASGRQGAPHLPVARLIADVLPAPGNPITTTDRVRGLVEAATNGANDIAALTPSLTKVQLRITEHQKEKIYG